MAKYRGKVAVCLIGANEIEQITDWALNLEGTAIDTSVIGTEWRSTVQGSRGWNATINGMIMMEDNTGQRELVDQIIDAAETGEVASVRFQAEDGTADGYYEGTGVVTGVSVTNPGNDDVVRVSITVQGDGALTYTDAT